MAVELKVPAVGESITEVQVGQWMKREGDYVDRDEPIVEIESDKATVEVAAPVAGVITSIFKQTGEAASVGEVIGQMEKADRPEGKSPAPAKTKAKAEAPVAAKSVSKSDTSAARVMPAAQRLLDEHGIAAGDVKGTGPGGRVLKEDVMKHAERKQLPAAVAEEAVAHGDREVEAVRMSPMRKKIAERLVEAQRTMALLTTFNEIDMSAAIALRKEHQEEFQKKYQIKLGFMSIFVKACVDALRQFPKLNAQIEGQDIVYHNYCDVGIAVGGGKGLVVPVLRSAERMSFAEVELAIADLGTRAKENRIKLDELQGGTFSISNGGIYGSMLSTPIVNPPQSGILGLHAIQDRVVAVDGQIVIRPMMYVALTYDHRIVDGREAVSFLKRVKQCVENPARMLIEV
ncbi:MAG: dihydrolipoyllysine-residue succinyltransferase component of 2-oxoglutarate dehydrogenase complex [Candidatus Hydrogenedentota bacterium]